MIKQTTIAAFLVCFSWSTGIRADGNELFSDVRPTSVYGNAQADSSSLRPSLRVTAASELVSLLNETGFSAKSEGARIATTEKRLEPWTFPVLVMVSEDENSVAIMMGLKSVEDAARLSADKLLQMMAAGQKNAPFVFSYSSIRKRTEIYTVVENRDLTGRKLRDQINRMAILARDNATLWADQNAASEADQPQESETPATTRLAKLTGTWSASRSDTEAFAIEVSADGKFKLVFVKGKSQTKSAGTLSITADELILNGSDGLKLSGAFRMASKSEFRFTPQNSTELTFKRAK